MIMNMDYKLILASNSPRRRELLGGLDVPFEVRVLGGIDETYPKDLSGEEIPQYISREKAQAYSLQPNEVLITADTIVYLDGRVYGKPADEAEACQMLRELSGRTHQVITGVTITTSQWQDSFSSVSHVTFAELTDDEISYYVRTYRPFDKAGAYGIQEWIGFVGVTSLEGSYFNVMGLPIQRLYGKLREHHIL
ncbi:MAG: septum formation protein Maf [Bacteroidaceae bacterium]|nr:septum formation protein Maf [Bacteroidaceae bacterium]